MSTTRAIDSTESPPDETLNDTTRGAKRSDGGRIWLFVTLVSGLVGLVLRLGVVATRDLWADEAFTWRITSAEFDRMFHRVQTDFHPPLHYLLLWLIQERTPDDWEPTHLRLANLVWFVGMAVLAAWAANRPRLRASVVPAFCVVAVAPGFVQHSAELRMYGMLLMLVAVLLVAVTSIVERPSWLAVVVATVVGTAAAWTHYAGVIAGTAIITAGLVRGGRKRFRSLAPVAAIFAAGVLTLIPFALPQLGHGIGYKVDMARVTRSILDDLSVLGLTLLILTAILACWAGIKRTATTPRPRLSEIGKISLLSLALFSLGMFAYYVVKGQNPVNEGVSTVPAYLLLVGVLGLRSMPLRTVVIVVLVLGVVTAGVSVARLWGAPNYSLGKRVSHVDVLDEAIREHPTLAADGGRGWLIVEVDWADMNNYFKEQASRRLPRADVAVGTPSAGVVKAKIEGSKGKYQRILVIRRPGTAGVGAIRGYELQIINRWTAFYAATP